MAPEGDRSGGQFVVIIVALAGLLSTLGAAALSGYWTNMAVEHQFETQRSAQIQDQRRQVYVDYLQRGTDLCAALEDRDAKRARSAAVAFSKQSDRAQLIASSEVRDQLKKMTELILNTGSCESVDPLYKSFFDAAKRELGNAP